MAGYRQFHTEFWKDEYIIELEPAEKLLYAYLFTNELSSISGLYKIPARVISNETGLDKDFVASTLSKFEDDRKIMYRDGVMWVVNMQKYHKNASPLTMKKVDNDVDEISDCLVKSVYLYYVQTGKYSIDTVSILISQRKREREKENKRETEKGIESESPAPAPSFQPVAPGGWMMRVFAAVTGMMSIPGNETEKVMPALDGLYIQFDRDETALSDYLKPYWAKWLTTKGKNNQPYKKTNCAWLYEWAVAGEMPGENKPADDWKADVWAATEKWEKEHPNG